MVSWRVSVLLLFALGAATLEGSRYLPAGSPWIIRAGLGGARVIWSSFCTYPRLSVCVFSTLTVLGIGVAWALMREDEEDRTLLIDELKRNEEQRRGDVVQRVRLGPASWSIIDEVVIACRAQLGLDRSSDPSDLATRQLVAKTCFGIITDRQRFPDLRRTDAERLVLIAREAALTPTSEELEALNEMSGREFAIKRSLARSSWGEEVKTRSGRGGSRPYVPAVTSPPF